MPDIRDDCLALEDSFGATLVLESFQGEKSLPGAHEESGVCRALGSLFIRGGILGTAAWDEFKSTAQLGSATAITAAAHLQAEQGRVLDRSSEEMGKWVLGVIAQDFPGKTLKPEQIYRLSQIGLDKELAKAVTQGATEAGVSLLSYSKDINVAGKPPGVKGMTFARTPLTWKFNENAFYLLGFGRRHAVAFYYGQPPFAFFYDANTGLWRVPFNKFEAFVQSYFGDIYNIFRSGPFSNEDVMLLAVLGPSDRVDNPMWHAVEDELAGAPSALAARRKPKPSSSSHAPPPDPSARRSGDLGASSSGSLSSTPPKVTPSRVATTTVPREEAERRAREESSAVAPPSEALKSGSAGSGGCRAALVLLCQPYLFGEHGTGGGYGADRSTSPRSGITSRRSTPATGAFGTACGQVSVTADLYGLNGAVYPNRWDSQCGSNSCDPNAGLCN